MLRSPPADTRVKCYKRKLLVPAADSLERIDRRLPLLEQLVAGKQLAPAVLDRVLPTLERDVQILSSPEEVQRMQDAARPQAPDAARKAKALLRKIRALMKASAKKASVKKTPADKTPAGR